MARRLISLIPVILIVSLICFSLIHITPGDAASAILGETATEEQLAKMRQSLGLDAPLYEQFLRWLGDVAVGDFGVSVFSGEPVIQIIWESFKTTFGLSLIAMLLSLVIAIPLAILAVWKRNSWMNWIFMSFSLLGVSIPAFWLALLLIIVFAVTLGWVPVAGYMPLSQGFWPWLSHLLLPAVVLSVQQAGLIARMLRDGMLEVMNQDYIRSARAKGAKEWIILLGHILPNAMIPTVTVIGVTIAELLGGAIIVESIFAIPGLGQLIAESISRRDFPVLQGGVLFIAVIYVLVNLLVDLAYAFFDPRIRYD
ncbi:ABC transporter permease [Paenibacillus beijingensis]|uniref:ABC transporter permease n=1 Tax=Paenibacillus beijingensis TaxID=1126833 RepID=UPI0023786C64|nr:ABC transporter permease [Paenibacillus beijingensis]